MAEASNTLHSHGGSCRQPSLAQRVDLNKDIVPKVAFWSAHAGTTRKQALAAMIHSTCTLSSDRDDDDDETPLGNTRRAEGGVNRANVLLLTAAASVEETQLD